MADWNVATGAEQAINRTGAPNCRVVGEDVQGALVGVSQNADDEWELVEADAGAEANGGTEINALGVLFPEEVVDLDALPTGAYLADIGAACSGEQNARWRPSGVHRLRR